MKSVLYIGSYLVVFFGSLWLLARYEHFGVTESIFAFLVLGVGFSVISWFATRKAESFRISVHQPAVETGLLLVWLLVITATLVWGVDSVTKPFSDPVIRLMVKTAFKLLIFVAVPFFIMRARRYRWSDLAPWGLERGQLRAVLIISGAMLIFQSVFGRGLRDIRAAHLPPWVLVIAIPLLFGWLMIEVGVVEEFFFRVLLQTRLEALFDSRWGGIVCTSLLFGLIHVPGLYLRPELTLEAVGAHPSLLMAIGYSIVLTSVAGLFFGVVWSRTRSFTAVVLIHAATDLLPGVVPMIQMLRK